MICLIETFEMNGSYEYPLQSINRFLQNKSLLYIGTISYGIYVFHYPILYYCTYIFDPFWAKIDFSFLGRFQKYTWHTWIIKFPLYSLLSIGLAALSYKFIETPILKLKDRFFKYDGSKRLFKVESSMLNVQG